MWHKISFTITTAMELTRLLHKKWSALAAGYATTILLTSLIITMICAYGILSFYPVFGNNEGAYLLWLILDKSANAAFSCLIISGGMMALFIEQHKDNKADVTYRFEDFSKFAGKLWQPYLICCIVQITLIFISTALSNDFANGNNDFYATARMKLFKELLVSFGELFILLTPFLMAAKLYLLGKGRKDFIPYALSIASLVITGYALVVLISNFYSLVYQYILNLFVFLIGEITVVSIIAIIAQLMIYATCALSFGYLTVGAFAEEDVAIELEEPEEAVIHR